MFEDGSATNQSGQYSADLISPSGRYSLRLRSLALVGFHFYNYPCSVPHSYAATKSLSRALMHVPAVCDVVGWD